MLLVFVILALSQPESSAVEVRRSEMTLTAVMDQEGVDDCHRLYPAAEVSVHLLCRLDAEGNAEHCDLSNLNPAAERSAPLVKCIVSHMNWSFSNGFPTEGLMIPFPFEVSAQE